MMMMMTQPLTLSKKEAVYLQVQRTTHQRLEQVELYLHNCICLHDK
jgi:hypothetical protein